MGERGGKREGRERGREGEQGGGGGGCDLHTHQDGIPEGSQGFPQLDRGEKGARKEKPSQCCLSSPTPPTPRIQFLYPPSSQLLFQVLANLQQTSCPILVVVDGLEEYLKSCPGPSVAAQLVALLLDTVNHFSQKLSRVSSACQLLVSMKSPGEAGEDGGHFSTVERYFQAQMWLHPEAEESVGPASHGATKVVRAHLSQPGSQDREWLLRFEPEGQMKISPLPCKSEDSRGAAAQNDTPAEAEAQVFLPGSQS
ncbi:ATPase SWSAP1 isoform X2 [Anolis carolinensis]|uniref:ATPase SWSAP1 isoform X2 n=1 Tax=Anolis carolinensis TaxID=28377 RepID=UPI002F2B66F3